MTVISYSQARQTLKGLLDKVIQSHEPVIIERRNDENCVVISESDYHSLEETAYLLRSPKNAQRLLEALQRSKETRKTFDTIKVLEDEITA